MNIEELLENNIKPTEYNLEEKYKLFNKLYFYNLLPTIPLSYSKSKTVGGQVKARYTKSGKDNILVHGSLSLSLTNLYKRTEEQFDGILLHEMIHVYFIVNGNFTEHHGRLFRELRKQISEKSGIDIPLTDSVTNLELSGDEAKEIGVVLIENRRDSSYNFALISKNAVDNNIKDIETFWITRLDEYSSARKVTVYKVNSMLFTKYALKYPVQRNLRNLMFYRLPIEGLEDIEKNGKEYLSMESMPDFTVKVIK